MNFAVVLIAFGGFLLGGAWSLWRGGRRPEGRTTAQVVFALILLVAALLATAAGILRLV